jgi:multimeric flavodoxin WrbA
MKILAIYGSPRANGNSDILLNEALNGVKAAGGRTEKVFVRNMKIRPCDEGRVCDRTGHCLIVDDMKQIYDKLEVCERVIVASPIFYYSVPSSLKAVIDRSQCYWARKYLLKQPLPEEINGVRRRGAFIAVAGTRGEKVFDGADLTIKYFFDSYNVEYAEKLFVRGADAKGEIIKMTEQINKAVELGMRMCK